jgi:hypothetical protein
MRAVGRETADIRASGELFAAVVDDVGPVPGGRSAIPLDRAYVRHQLEIPDRCREADGEHG